MDFEREVAKHKDAVYRQMVRVCGNIEDAEDVLVEAIVKAHRASDQLDDPASFRAWLTTIGKRVCIRMRSTNRIKSESIHALEEIGFDVPSDEPSQQESLELQETHACVLGAYESLPKIYKNVYRMREIEGLSAEQVADRLGISVSAVKSRLHRAREHVRQRLDSAMPT